MREKETTQNCDPNETHVSGLIFRGAFRAWSMSSLGLLTTGNRLNPPVFLYFGDAGAADDNDEFVVDFAIGEMELEDDTAGDVSIGDDEKHLVAMVRWTIRYCPECIDLGTNDAEGARKAVKKKRDMLFCNEYIFGCVCSGRGAERIYDGSPSNR